MPAAAVPCHGRVRHSGRYLQLSQCELPLWHQLINFALSTLLVLCHFAISNCLQYHIIIIFQSTNLGILGKMIQKFW